MAAENRVVPRYPADFPVDCRGKDQRWEGRALNLSRGGLLIATPELLAIGKMLEVRFVLPPGSQLLELRAIVRHATGEQGCGVEFLELLPKHQAMLGSHLDQLDAAFRPASS